MNKEYSDISITWHGDVTSISGYAQHARKLLTPLMFGGASVRIEPIKTANPQVKDDQWNRLLSSAINSPPGIVNINHCGPGSGKPNPNGGPNIIFTHWESANVPVSWVAQINNYTELWTTNKHGLKGSSAINIPTKVIRFPMNLDNYSNAGEPTSIVGLDDKVMVIGCTGQWNNRKNMSDLIIAYCSAFSTHDNVVLVIKANTPNVENPNEKNKVLDLIRQIKANINTPDMPKVIVVQDILTENAMDALLQRFTIYATASRGESKDISLLKCLAMGKPAIFINNLSHKEVVDSTGLNGSRYLYPIDYVQEPIIQMGQVYTASDSWARPDTTQMAQQMKKAYIDCMSVDFTRERKKTIEGLKSLYDPKLIEKEFVEAIRSAMPFKVEPALTAK